LQDLENNKRMPKLKSSNHHNCQYPNKLLYSEQVAMNNFGWKLVMFPISCCFCNPGAGQNVWLQVKRSINKTHSKILKSHTWHVKKNKNISVDNENVLSLERWLYNLICIHTQRLTEHVTHFWCFQNHNYVLTSLRISSYLTRFVQVTVARTLVNSGCTWHEPWVILIGPCTHSIYGTGIFTCMTG